VALALAGLLGVLAAAGSSLRPPRLAVPEQGVVLDDVTVVRPGAGRSFHRTVVVRGDRIARIADRAAGAGVGPYTGAFVLPGLIDLHVHHPPAFALAERELFALLFLAHGVTTVRDTGTVLTPIEGHRRRIEAGELAGPRLFSCGPVLDGEPPTWPGSRVVTDAAGAERAVAELAGAGADCVKLYNRLAPEVVAALLRAAAERGLPVVAHVPERTSIALLPGVEVQHLTGLTAHWGKVTPARIAWYVEVSRSAGIAHTPTLEAFGRQAEIAAGGLAPIVPGARLLPRYHRDLLWDPARNPLALALSPAGGSTIPERLAVMGEVVLALQRAGVAVRVGSDAGNVRVVPGAGLHEEMRRLVEAGLEPEVVWDLATRGGAAALGWQDLGRLEEGALADLLVFRSDPSRDLAALESLEAVVADGRLYPRAALDAAVARWRAHFDGRLYRTLSGLAARALLRAAPTRP
jgi:imidazolonepropionase-like amidohydrolase